MLRNVFLKTLRDRRRSMMWWGIGLAFAVVFVVAIYPSVTGFEGMEDLVEQYPENLLALLGVSEAVSILTPAGYLNAELFGLMLPILFIVFTIAQGSGAIAGEERAGTMELLLSLPITRGRVVLEKFASMVVSTVALALIVWVVLILGKYAIDMDIGVIRLGEMVASLTLLGLAFGTAAFAIGSITGDRGASVGVAAATAVAAYILDALNRIVDFIEPTKWLSPFYYYNSGTPLVNGLSLVHVIVLLAIVMTCMTAAYFGFRRRDARWQ